MPDTQPTNMPAPDGLEGTGFAAMREEAHKAGDWHDENDVTTDVLRAKAELGEAHAERAAFDRTRAARDELRTRHPDATLAELITNVMQWDRRFKVDPAVAADALARYYLSQSAAVTKGADDKGEKHARPAADVPPDDPDGDIRAAMQQVRLREAEENEFAASAQQRAALKEAFPHLSLDEAIQRAVALDRELREEPLRAAERLAATYGLPITAQHQQEVAHAARLVQGVSAIKSELKRTTAAGQFPGLQYMASDIAEVLDDPGFTSTGNIAQDLATAYRLALPAVMARAAREHQAQAVAKAKHASSSVDGAPASGALTNSDRRRIRDDLAADIRGAMRRV